MKLECRYSVILSILFLCSILAPVQGQETLTLQFRLVQVLPEVSTAGEPYQKPGADKMYSVVIATITSRAEMIEIMSGGAG